MAFQGLIAGTALDTTNRNASQSRNTGAKRFGDTFFKTSGNTKNKFLGAAGNIFDPQNISGIFGGGGDDDGGYQYTPYSGLRPPRVDYTDATGNDINILRPTQKQTFDILMRRSRGEDVGYDPERRQLLTDLVKSEMGMREEDQLRDTRGALSASGLSGNPRAYEALAGRVQRDNSRALSNDLSRIAIEDLTRANEERDINTARLQDFNTFNFGQENRAADFDLDVYRAENASQLGFADFGEGVRQYETNRSDDRSQGIGSLAGSLLGDKDEDDDNSNRGGYWTLLPTQTQYGSGYGAAPSYNSYGNLSQIGSNQGYRNFGRIPRNYTR